jgi:hypothetical protein
MMTDTYLGIIIEATIIIVLVGVGLEIILSVWNHK